VVLRAAPGVAVGRRADLVLGTDVAGVKGSGIGDARAEAVVERRAAAQSAVEDRADQQFVGEADIDARAEVAALDAALDHLAERASRGGMICSRYMVTGRGSWRSQR
jgi:hypothetical protein